jgi:hypothetical protein
MMHNGKGHSHGEVCSVTMHLHNLPIGCEGPLSYINEAETLYSLVGAGL